MFYTYAHYTPLGDLFYIGKGHGRRAYNLNSKNRNRFWNNVVAKHGKPHVHIVRHWKTEAEAFAHEVELIAQFTKIGIRLCNLSTGGDGPTSGFKATEEQRKRRSESQKGRPGKKPSPETLIKLRESHLGQKAWNKGLKGVSKQSDETKRKISEANLRRTYKPKFKYIGTSILTGEVVVLAGNKNMISAGFNPSGIRRSANNSGYSHNGYTWCKELIEVIKC